MIAVDIDFFITSAFTAGLLGGFGLGVVVSTVVIFIRRNL